MSWENMGLDEFICERCGRKVIASDWSDDWGRTDMKAVENSIIVYGCDHKGANTIYSICQYCKEHEQ